MKKTNSVQKFVLLALPLALLAGCGGGDKAEAPVGSTIRINPSAVMWTVTVAPATSTGCNPATDEYFYQELNISVIGPNGRPINNAQLYVTLDLSLETSSSDSQRLYDDPTWVAGPSPAVVPAGRVSGSYVTSTGDFGTKRLIVATEACTHAGNMNVFSGTAFGTINFAVE